MQHFWGKFKLIHILNDHAWLIHSNQLPVSVIPNECVYLSAASVSLIWIRSFVGTEDAVLTGYWSHLPNIHKVPESQLLVADVRRDPCVVPHLAGYISGALSFAKSKQSPGSRVFGAYELCRTTPELRRSKFNSAKTLCKMVDTSLQPIHIQKHCSSEHSLQIGFHLTRVQRMKP